MKLFKSKKAMAIGLAAALTVGVAGGAFAYFTSTGGGTGTASVGVSSAVTITGTSAVAAYPDGAAVDVTILVHNPGSGAQNVGNVTLASVDSDSALCDSSVPTVFTMADVPVGLIAAGATKTVHGSLQMHDTGSDQDACQGSGLTLNFTSN
jgi:hypothetical protein